MLFFWGIYPRIFPGPGNGGFKKSRNVPIPGITTHDFLPDCLENPGNFPRRIWELGSAIGTQWTQFFGQKDESHVPLSTRLRRFLARLEGVGFFGEQIFFDFRSDGWFFKKIQKLGDLIWVVVSNILFSPLIWGRFPIWLIFFRWAETTN